MDAKPSNAGFVELHSPFGMFLVGAAILFFIALIAIGSRAFRRMQKRDQEERERLRSLKR